MKLRPAQNCLGCCTLAMGVEATCALSLCLQILTLCLCSSSEPLQLMGLYISPEIQVFCGSWAFVGIPITVAGGVGALHRIESTVRLLFLYCLGSLLLCLCIPAYFMYSNSLCDLMVDPALQSQGTAFICGFADSFFIAWSLMANLTYMFIVYIVWSAAEDIRLIPNPELMRYEDALKGTGMPHEHDDHQDSAVPTPEMMAKSAFANPHPMAMTQTPGQSPGYGDARQMMMQQPQQPQQSPGFGDRGAVSLALSAAAAAAQGQGGPPMGGFRPAPPVGGMPRH